MLAEGYWLAASLYYLDRYFVRSKFSIYILEDIVNESSEVHGCVRCWEYNYYE